MPNTRHWKKKQRIKFWKWNECLFKKKKKKDFEDFEDFAIKKIFQNRFLTDKKM